MKWLISAFNIIRVRFCYNLFAAVVCTSIAAHLFIVSMTAMSLVLWVRRKGMSDKGKVENSYDEDTESDSDSLSSMSSSSKTEKNKKSSVFSRKQKVSNDDSA